MCNYHPIAIEWILVVTDKFLFHKMLENVIYIPTIHANIKVTSELVLY